MPARVAVVKVQKRGRVVFLRSARVLVPNMATANGVVSSSWTPAARRVRLAMLVGSSPLRSGTERRRWLGGRRRQSGEQVRLEGGVAAADEDRLGAGWEVGLVGLQPWRPMALSEPPARARATWSSQLVEVTWSSAVADGQQTLEHPVVVPGPSVGARSAGW